MLRCFMVALLLRYAIFKQRRYLPRRLRIISIAPNPTIPVASNARLTGSGVGTGELAEA
jgi:hypothetical protein